MGEEEEFYPGVDRISLRRGKKKDGTNWVMFAGGAIAMAVSVAFGRKKIFEEGPLANDDVEEEEDEHLTTSLSGIAQASHQEGGENGSLQTSVMVPNGALQWGNTQLALPSSTKAEFDQFQSFKPQRPAPTDPSPPVAKFTRHSSKLSKDELIQFDSQISSTLQSGAIASLRQQIKSRDAIIHDMQTQLADQDQMIAVHRSHSIDLQDCVQALSTKLFKANLENQRLQRELMAHHAKSIVDLNEELTAYSEQPWLHHKDVEEIILEAKKLSDEEVEHVQRESEAKEKVAQAKSRQCEVLVKRLSVLTSELEEANSAVHGKQRLLEAKEQECLKLADVVQDLQHKLEIEARGKGSQERSVSMNLVMKQTDVHDIKLSHTIDQPTTPSACGKVPSTFAYHGKGYALQGCEGYGGNREAPGDQDGGMTDNGLVLNFECEAGQLASALPLTSQVVSEKVQDAEQRELEGEVNVKVTKHQEKIAEETSLIFQQLSTSPQCPSSPYNPPVQEAGRTVQDTPRSPVSHNTPQEHPATGSPDENFRNASHKSPQFCEYQASFFSAFNQNGDKAQRDRAGHNLALSDTQRVWLDHGDQSRYSLLTHGLRKNQYLINTFAIQL